MAKKTVHPLANDQAFTLVELMVALAMATFFIMITMTLADVSTQSYRAQERVSNAQQSVRAALDMMVRDIRMAGYDPMSQSFGPTAGIGILTATATDFQYTADLNADQIDNGGRENIRYFYDAAMRRLRQQEGGATAQTFIENVSALNFTYLDVDGNPAATNDSIAMIVVTLSVQDRNQQGGTFQRTLTTRINCRNLRL